MGWLTDDMLTTLIASGLSVLAALLGAAIGFWGSNRLQKQATEAERNRVSYAIFAGLLSVREFLNQLLEDESDSLPQKIQQLSETDFYWRVLEANLGNLGTLGPGEAVLLYDVYKDLKIIGGRCSAAIGRVEPHDIQRHTSLNGPAVSDEFGRKILHAIESVLENTALLVSMMTQQHGFELLTLDDLAAAGVEMPPGLIGGDPIN